MAETIKVGDEVVVVYPQRLAFPTRAKIIAITNEPGKVLGVQFESPVGIHSCDGRGQDKHCMWIHPDNLLTMAQGEELLNRVREVQSQAVQQELVLEIDHTKGTKKIVPAE
jgi:hypothetical protein